MSNIKLALNFAINDNTQTLQAVMSEFSLIMIYIVIFSIG